MAPPRRTTLGQESGSDDEEEEGEEETYVEQVKKVAPPIKYNNLAEEITAAIRLAEASAAKATSMALAASMKPAYSFNPSMPPPLPPGTFFFSFKKKFLLCPKCTYDYGGMFLGPDGYPYNEACARCHALHLHNSRMGVNMQNFRAMYTNLHRDYMQLYSAHNELAEQNSTLTKSNSVLDEQVEMTVVVET